MKRRDGQKVVGYIRVSTDEQQIGPEAQREALRRYCATTGSVLVAVHEDLGVSGGLALDKRPGLLAALASLDEHKAGVLLVAKRDRLARDVVVSGMVERLVERVGGKLLSADGTGNGAGPEHALRRNIVAAFAEYERALIRARTRAALAVKRARSERVGQVPFGYIVGADGKLLPDAKEQAVVERIKDLRARRLTIKNITATLNREGAPARGGRWHATTIARLLRRAA